MSPSESKYEERHIPLCLLKQNRGEGYGDGRAKIELALILISEMAHLWTLACQ